MDPAWPWSELRCFTLARSPAQGPPRLEPEDEQHLARVLRAKVGDRVVGLDGSGRAWPLRVQALGKVGVELQADGEPWREPAPGEPGARVARVEVAAAWPKPQAAEDLVDALTQVGCARVTALVAERSQGWAGEWSPSKRERLERAAREACKQARRLWRLEIDGPRALSDWLAAAEPERTVVLEPRATTSLEDWTRALGGPGAVGAVRLVIGPEGGWAPAELEAFAHRGVASAALRCYVLRAELAAPLAAAVVLQRLPAGGVAGLGP